MERAPDSGNFFPRGPRPPARPLGWKERAEGSDDDPGPSCFFPLGEKYVSAERGRLSHSVAHTHSLTRHGHAPRGGVVEYC